MPVSEKLRYALLMSAAAAAACSGSESDAEEQFLDGGGMTVTDAATEQPGEDAGPMDAGGDGDSGHDAGLDAGLRVGSITVTTYVRDSQSAVPGLAPQTPQANVDVVVVNPDGTVGPKGKTGPDGVLVLEGVFEGSLVSALYPVDNNVRVNASYAGVMPGDSLKFGDSYFVPERSGTAGSHTVTFDPYEGATTYTVQTSCSYSGDNDGSTSRTMDLYSYCQGATISVRLRAFDSDGEVIATKYVANIDGTPDSATTISGWNPIPATDNFTALRGEIDPLVEDFRFYVDLPYDLDFTAYDDDWHYPNPDQAIGYRLPTDATRLVQNVRFYPANHFFGRHDEYKTVPLSAGSTTVSGGGELPWMTGAALSHLGVLWQQTSGTYDGAVAMLRWERQTDASTEHYEWNVVIPPGLTSFSLQDLPADLADLAPTQNDVLDYRSRITLVDLSSADGYDALRATPEWLLTCPDCAVRAGDVPSARVTGLSVDGAEGGLPW